MTQTTHAERAQTAFAFGAAFCAFISQLSERCRQRTLRHEYRAMMDLDEHLLKDMGVTRGQVSWAASLPLNVDAERQIRDMAYASRAS